MHECVVLACSAPSLPCKRAGRRASSGISFSNAVQQAQLSYPKSAQLGRLLEAFEGFGFRSSPQPQTLLDQQYLGDVDSLILCEVLCCTSIPTLHPLDQPTRSRQDPIFPTARSPRCISHAICTSHTAAAKRLRTTTFWRVPGTWDAGDGNRQIKRAPRMKVLSTSPSHAIIRDLPNCVWPSFHGSMPVPAARMPYMGGAWRKLLNKRHASRV